MDYKQNVALFLKTLIERKGLKKAHLAAELSISQGRLTQYLEAKELPRAETLLKIAELAGVLIDEVLTGERPDIVAVTNKAEKQYVLKLLRILRSNDEIIKGAIIPNLIAFDDRLIIEQAKKNRNDQ